MTYTHTYTIDGVANQTPAWLAVSESDVPKYPSFTISTTDPTFAGTYSVSLTTSVNDGTSTFSDTIAFSFVLVDPCLTAPWLTVTIQDMTTTILASPVLAPQIFPVFGLDTAVDCGTITYTLGNTLAFVTVSSTDRSITVNPTLSSELGVHSTSIIAKLD